jgi:LacI family transcriptional regulator
MGEMGRAVVEILLERMSAPDAPPVVRQLPVELVLRESCGC